MKTLNDFFHEPVELPVHPRLREWKERLSHLGVEAKLELYRPTIIVGLAPTEMILLFFDHGVPEPAEQYLWDDDLNSGLIQLGVRAVNPDDEFARFALGLRAA